MVNRLLDQNLPLLVLYFLLVSIALITTDFHPLMAIAGLTMLLFLAAGAYFGPREIKTIRIPADLTDPGFELSEIRNPPNGTQRATVKLKIRMSEVATILFVMVVAILATMIGLTQTPLADFMDVRLWGFKMEFLLLIGAMALMLSWAWLRERVLLRYANSTLGEIVTANDFGRRFGYRFHDESGDVWGNQFGFLGSEFPSLRWVVVFYDRENPELSRCSRGLRFHAAEVILEEGETLYM